MARKPSRKAPPGCYWRKGVLWGRIQKVGGDIRWSLHTSDSTLAIRLRAERAKEIADEIHHGIEPKRAIDQVIAEWTPHIKRNVGPKTAKRYGVSLDQIEPYIAGKTLDQINVKLIASIVDARMATGVTNATIKRDLGALSQVLNFAISRGYTEQNAALIGLRTIKERRNPIILPVPAHIEMVIQRCPPNLAKMAMAAWRTGARQDELVNATCGAVDHQRMQLTIVGKGNKLRTIDLVPFNGYEAFSERTGVGAKPIFPSGTGAAYKSVASWFYKIARKVEKRARKDGVDFRPFCFHHLRHRHAVDWLKDGRSIYDLQQRLGHASVTTTELYLDYLTGDEKKLVMFGPTSVART
jgi:integrase/recombinase XerD